VIFEFGYPGSVR